MSITGRLITGNSLMKKNVLLNYEFMGTKSRSFDEYVIRGILANNPFGIMEVNSIRSLKSIFFVSDEYPAIEKLIKTGNICAIKALPEGQLRTGEFLDIMLFKDQKEEGYIVTVYDSVQLEQNPQVIEIYSLASASL